MTTQNPNPDPPDEVTDAAQARAEAARQMGLSRSSQKGEAPRANGQRGGRPRGSANDEATRERMKEAQRKRRQSEKAEGGE